MYIPTPPSTVSHPPIACATLSTSCQTSLITGATSSQLLMISMAPAASAAIASFAGERLITLLSIRKARDRTPTALPATRSAAPSFATDFTISGFSLTRSRTCSSNGITSSAASLIIGRKVSPSVTEMAFTLFLSRVSWFSVVAAREAYSFCIEPPYCWASATRSKLIRSRSILVRSGAIAPADSLPNNIFIAAACFSFGIFDIPSSTFSIVPFESFCISAASFFGSIFSAARTVL